MKALISALVLMSSLSVFAQDASRGANTNNGGFRNSTPSTAESRIDIGGGRSTLRINVYDRNEIDQNMRIRRLEEAVRDLQYQVFDIRDQQPVIVRVHVCTIQNSGNQMLIGKGSTRIEAEAQARNACQSTGRNCFTSTLRCEIQEETRY